jgi:predicted dehydrogenase
VTDKTIGAAVVGTGFGVLVHLRALRAAGFEVLALVGRDPDRTAARAAQAGVPHACTSLTDALAITGVDAVTVATPPHTHHDLVVETVGAGRHVVCEKPFARNAEESAAMLAAAQQAGVVHQLGTEFRWATGQATATRAVSEGLIGEPRLTTFMFDAPLLTDPSGEVPSWWSDASQGGGWLGAYGSHVIDQLRTMLGEFTRVSASVQHLSGNDWTADDAFTVYYRTERGSTGTMQSSVGSWGPFSVCAKVVGTAGTLWIEGDVVRVADGSGERALPVPADLVLPAPEPPDPSMLVTTYDLLHSTGLELAPYTRLFETFSARISGSDVDFDPAPATFADGVAGQRVLDAIRRSSAAGGDWTEVGA